ncbi:MAG: BON domain-containing protein [Acidobacteriaceae bacterium]|nr:BON domain-containing protein [Acidobacteriaceae bacterium]
MTTLRKHVLVLAMVAVTGFGAATSRAQSASDQALDTQVHKALSNKRFGEVQVSTQGGVVTLNGQVARYYDLEDAAKKAAKVHGVSGVANNLTVGGARVPDEQLFQKISQKLLYDRNGYGTQMFNVFAVGVKDGVVTVDGSVVQPVDKDSALNIVKDEPGVRGLVDHIHVQQLSPNDNRIRVDVGRAVYGAPQLNRYALNPARPIRISVEGGHVTLYGVVDTKGDREVAGIRANSVPGVFSVKNQIAVAGQRE